MSKYLNDYNLHVLTNIISGVETYGQRYSDQRNWGDFTPAYANTSNQVSITIGWAANYGEEARRLLQMILQDYPRDFKNNDTCNIINDLNKPFTTYPYYQPERGSSAASAIVNIITSQGGKKTQDKLFGQLMEAYMDQAVKFGVNKNNIPALMMWCEISHLGGGGPVKRIFNRCGLNPSLDNIMTALKQDQANGNTAEVGDKMFQSRHQCCYNWIKQYMQPQKEVNIVGVDFNNYYGQISNSGSDERGSYAGGQAGDQTGNEWCIRSWYNRPWNCVIRYPDRKVGDLLAELGIEAAKNNLIGYDQYQRDTYWQHLKASNYRPSQITIACEADCSAGVIANTKAVGYLLGISILQKISATYTGNMRDAYKNAGFQILTDSKYLNSFDYLMPGDILLNDAHHTATNLGIGKNSGYKQEKINSNIDVEKIDSNVNVEGTGEINIVLNTTSKRIGRVKQEGLYVRTWAGKENPQIKSWPKLSKDSLVDICDTIKDSEGNNWYYIRIDGHIYGFSMSKYIKKV